MFTRVLELANDVSDTPNTIPMSISIGSYDLANHIEVSKISHKLSDAISAAQKLFATAHKSQARASMRI